MLLQKNYNYITALVAAFPLLGARGSVFAIILWCVYSLALFIRLRPGKFEKKNYTDIAVLSSLYLAYLVSFFLSDDKKEIGRFLERNIAFLLFPVFMILNRKLITKDTLRISLNSFVASNIILCLYVWGVMLSKGIGRLFEEDQYYNPVIRNVFNDSTGIHLPYLGMLFIFASAVLLYDLFTARNRKLYLALKIAAIMLLLGSTAVFMARISLATFVVIVVFYALILLKSKKKIALVFIPLLIVLCGVLMLPSSQRRVKEVVSAKYELPYEGQPSEQVNFRYGIYNCVASILQDKWLIGVGPGNVQRELDSCYAQYTYKNSDDYQHISYNSHSQYFDVWLKFGVFGLVAFFIFLFWGIKNTDMRYKAFIIIIFIALLTENMFTRQTGVIFFTFFNTLFFVTRKNNNYIPQAN